MNCTMMQGSTNIKLTDAFGQQGPTGHITHAPSDCSESRNGSDVLLQKEINANRGIKSVYL